MKVCVIGAGVIGVTSAYLLAREGHEVTLVDARAQPAERTSFANGGQLSYSYVAPLAAPDVWPNLPVWLCKRDSPLRFTPRLDPQQWRWSLAFALASNATQARTSTAQMLTLSYLSRDELDRLLVREPLDFHHVRNGKLIVYRDPAKVERARELVRYQSTHGASQQVLTAAETLALEPAIAAMGSALAGAIYTPSEEAGDCHAFTTNLFQRFLALPGARAEMGQGVLGLVRSGNRIVAAQTGRGDITADAFVVATGVGTRALLDPLGQYVPIYPLKGYSLSVDLEPDDGVAPAISVTDYEQRIVYARLGSVLRIAAMVDIGARDDAVDTERIAQLKQQVRTLFPALNLDTARVWAGLRPATPTGKPVIGRSTRASNLWLNVGHGALGFTLACGSARLLCSLLGGEKPPIDPAPFAAA